MGKTYTKTYVILEYFKLDNGYLIFFNNGKKYFLIVQSSVD